MPGEVPVGIYPIILQFKERILEGRRLEDPRGCGLGGLLRREDFGVGGECLPECVRE
jgi:hypothetical protein